MGWIGLGDVGYPDLDGVGLSELGLRVRVRIRVSRVSRVRVKG